MFVHFKYEIEVYHAATDADYVYAWEENTEVPNTNYDAYATAAIEAQKLLPMTVTNNETIIKVRPGMITGSKYQIITISELPFII